MSLDLEVFGPDRPGDLALPDALADKGVVVDGPLEVDDEDLPEVVAPVLLACRWTVQINMPASLGKTALKQVERYARGLAEAAGGVVYDPQSDAIVFPRSVKRLREPAVSRESEYEGAVLRLEWLVTRRLRAPDADALLDVLERRMPEALPRRFGSYEPMQGRLERDGRDAFTALWDADESPFWRGRRPFEWAFTAHRGNWGSALTPEEREALTPVIGGHKAPLIDGVSLTFRAEVAADARWRDGLAALFGAVARALDPFFAAAYVDVDRDAVLMGRYWLGIPPGPLWLVWAGPAYRELVPGLPEGVVRGEEVDWPPELVRQRGDFQDERLAARVIPNLAGQRPWVRGGRP